MRFACKTYRITMHVLFFLFLATLFCSTHVNGREADSGGEEKQLKIVFFIPRYDPFWKTNVEYARAVALDLGLNLEIVDFNDDPESLLTNVERVCRDDADGIIFQAFQSVGEEVLRIAEQYRTPAFLINTEIKDADFPPRTKYQYWVGKMTPDDSRVGTTLIQQLLSRAGKKGITEFHILGIEGKPDQEASIERRNGLETYIKYATGVKSFTLVPGDWDPDKAASLLKKHYRENPDINVVWCANDNMALAAADAVDELNINKPLFIGGVDWDPRALKAIEEGRMHASVGGHFIEGGWAVLFLHDYLKGKDFSVEGVNFTTSMPAINADNIEIFSHFLSLNPADVDFQNYSKSINSRLTEYKLDLARLAADMYESKKQSYENLGLTPEELAFLESHKKIRIGVMDAWPPMNFLDETGRPDGIGAAYINALNKRLNNILVIESGPFSENLEQVKNKKLDALMDVTPKPEREEYLNFTRDYLNIPHVIIARKGGPYYNSEDDLNGKTLALEKGFYNVKYFKEKYPDVKIDEYPDTSRALDAVARGSADAYAGNRAVAVWLLEKELISNLQVQGRLNKPGSILAVGVRKDWPELVSILNKTLAAIPMDEIRLIRRQWAGIALEEEEILQALLTPKELQFLSSHPEIKFGAAPDFSPFDYIDDQNMHAGISSDYINLLSQKLGVKIVLDLEKDQNWSQVLEKARSGRIDIVSAITPVRERKEYLNFTRPYIKAPLVIITNEDAPFIESVEDLKKTPVAVVKEHTVIAILEQNHPDLKLMKFDSMESALQAVSSGETMALVDAIATVDFARRRMGLTNLKVAALTPYSLELSIGVRKDWPELVSILNKALELFSEEEKSFIQDKWVNLRVEKRIDWGVVWKYVIAAVLVTGIILTIIIIWNRRLSREVAERKSAEIKLQESEMKMRAMSEAVHDALIMIDSASNVLFWNQAAVQIFGYSVEDALGRNMHELFVPEEYHEAAAGGLEEFAKTGKGPVVGTLIEHTALNRDGTPFPVEIAVSAFKVNEEWFAVGTVRDITERKLMENALRESEKNFRIIADYTYDWEGWHGADGSLLWVNPAVERITGYSVSDCMDMHDYPNPFVHPDDRNIFSSLNEQALSGKEGNDVPFRIIHKSNTEVIWAAISWNPVIDDNNLITGYRTSVREITERKLAEDAVREAEERGRLVLESAGDGIVGVDKNGRAMFVNPAALKMLGFKTEELLGQNIHEVFHHSHKDGRPYTIETCPMHMAYTQGTIHHIDEEILWRKDGSFFPADYTATPIIHGDELTGAVIAFQDITERKRSESEFRKLSKAVEQSPASVVITDRTGAIEYVNPAFTEVTGYSPEEVIGRNPRVLKSGKHPPEFYKELWSTIRNKQTWQGEFINRKKNGKIFWESASISSILDESGEIVRFLAVKQDISENKKLEQETHDARQKAEELSRNFSDFLESTSDLVYLKDTDLRYIACSRPLAVMLGYEDWREVIGKTENEVQNERSLIRFKMDPELRVIEEGATMELTEDVIHLGDRKGWASTVKKPLYSSTGDVVGLLSVSRDITKMKEAEAALAEAKKNAEEATRAKSNFLANMSHEIRTPMNAVIGMTHLALKTELDAKQFDYLKKIESAAQSLLGIINDILDFSKIEAGKLDIEHIEFDLHECLNSVADMIRVKAQEKEDLEVLFRTAPDAPRFLVGDPTRLNQVLINLGSNAVKFTERGEILLSTELAEKIDGRVRLKFSVRDTGIGMTVEQQNHLFQAFSQADSSTTRKFGGTGLGLTISKRLVELMGGDIGVESVSGEGSTFTFTAVFQLSEGRDADLTASAEELQGMRVLVVDDNATARQIFEEMLISLSFRPVLASNGKEGVEKFLEAQADDPFQLVLMDWKMPVMDGVEATMEIRKLADPARTPRIIMITAYAADEFQEAAARTELDGMLIKPLSNSSMFDAIATTFGKTTVRRRTFSNEEKQAELVAPIRGASVLLVEDNEINQQVAREVLEMAGFKVDIAENGKEAIQAVENFNYDAVLMDIQMPVMDGFEATKTIRNLTEERLKSLPIIAMTAHAMSGDREKSLEAGMNDHITKPLDTLELFSALAKWIKPGPGLGPETSKRTTDRPSVEEIQIPDLPGIDIEAGVRRVGGNKKLYLNLLEKFRNDYSDAERQIKERLESGDREGARMLAHTIKGVSGNIGAMDLQSTSAEVEAWIKDNKPGGIEQALAPLYTSLSSILKSLSNLETKQPAEAPDETPPDKSKLLELLERLTPHVQQRKPKSCKALLEEAAGSAWPASMSADFEKFKKMVGRYKFKEAEHVLELLINQLRTQHDR